VLLSGDETDGQFGIITATSPAGDIIPTHAHNGTHETFYILEGKVRLFFVNAAGDKTTELLSPGDFAYVPAGTPHAYRIEENARLTGTMTGGFERFFQHMGTATDHATTEQLPFVPDFPRVQAAAQEHNMQFMPDYEWPTAEERR
jgi:quercetin 2,3-dioxygenase